MSLKGYKQSTAHKNKRKLFSTGNVYGSLNKGRKCTWGKKISKTLTGSRHTAVTKQKMSIARKGKYLNELCPNWKGDAVGYGGLHLWIRQKLGNPKHCEHCKSTTEKRYEWSNIDHKYRRKLQDYTRLCTSCHRKYDRRVLKIKYGQIQR